MSKSYFIKNIKDTYLFLNHYEFNLAIFSEVSEIFFYNNSNKIQRKLTYCFNIRNFF